MKAAIETLGCRVNIYDSEAMTELFANDGYEIVSFSDAADVYVINTCTVTNMGDKKSRQLISRARRQNPQAVVCVVGCYSQVAPDEIAALEGVDVVLGSRNKSQVVELVNRSLATGEQLVEVSDIAVDHEFEELQISNYSDRTRAFLKIQDGCNRFCTYCMIPYARGGISSKKPDQVISEIRLLAQHGFAEIILSGIHIASYGLDQPIAPKGILLDGHKRTPLIDLLEEIEAVPEIRRVRIGSIDPMFFNGDQLTRIKSLTKLAPHFHLSLQAGSDRILQKMNRRYTTREFANVVAELRKTLLGVNITTDLITGFPGETEGDHLATLDFLKQLKLTKTHVFKYSPRAGTPAAIMPDQIDPGVKDQRSLELVDLSDHHEALFHQAMIGTVCEVLFEGGEGDVQRGFTPNFVEVKVQTRDHLKGKLLPVEITGSSVHFCWGRVGHDTESLNK